MSGFDFRVHHDLEKMNRTLDRIATALERIAARPGETEVPNWRRPAQPRTFDQPLTRYVNGDPPSEGDWQLHDDGHEGEDK